MSFAIDYPWALGVAGGLALAAVGVVWFEFVRRRKRLARLGPDATIVRLLPAAVAHARLGKRSLWLGTSALLAGIALAGPRWGAPMGVAETEGIDVVYAIDASLSMMAQDESPDRLERAKHEARRLRALSRGDRVALIAFAGRAYILTPLTADDGALALFLDNLDPSIVGQPGSSLASAIHMGVDLLGPAAGNDRALVVFTDGEAWDERPLVVAEAKRARDQNVSLVMVGFGTVEGSTIPIKVGYEAFAPKRDSDGHVVVTHYDPNTMRAAADAAGGTVIDPETTDKASRVRAALVGLRSQRRKVNAQRSIPARFQWFLAPALLLLFWDFYAANRRGRTVAAIGAMLAGLTMFGAPSTASAQTRKALEDAEKQYKDKNPLVAARSWKRALESGDRRPQTLYNLGTAYLAADSLDAAIEVLERASTMPTTKEMHDDVTYNLGLAYLKRGRGQKGDVASTSFKGAMRSYRSVLLGNAKDEDARWNYELARKKEQESSSSSGGGGQNQQNPQQNPQNGLAKSQAAQLLDAASRDERDVLDKHQRAEQVKAVRGRDW